MALVTFGGAYAVLAYVAQQAVTTYHWVTPGEMLDGLGMAETTPGPLIMVLQFVGFMAAFRAPGPFPPLLAGALGGLLATWVTFTPCFFGYSPARPTSNSSAATNLCPARSRRSRRRSSASSSTSRSGSPFTRCFATRAISADSALSFDAPVLASLDVWSLILALGAAIAIFRFKVGMIPTLLACSAAGVLLHFAGVV